MNKQRGEIEIELGGETYLARPTHEAIAGIEARTNAGIIGIAGRAVRQSLSSAEILAVLWECIKAGLGKIQDREMPWKFDEFKDLVFKEGLINMSTPTVALVSTMVSGETEEEQDEKNESSTDTESPQGSK